MTEKSGGGAAVLEKPNETEHRARLPLKGEKQAAQKDLEGSQFAGPVPSYVQEKADYLADLLDQFHDKREAITKAKAELEVAMEKSKKIRQIVVRTRSQAYLMRKKTTSKLEIKKYHQR